MKRLTVRLASVLALSLTLTACNPYDPNQRVLGGAAIGAGTGAALGAIAGGGRGAALGAILGGGVGAVTGAATTPTPPPPPPPPAGAYSYSPTPGFAGAPPGYYAPPPPRPYY
jgi:hypothetical protein